MMPVTIKTEQQIELMREAGKRLEEVHMALRDRIRPGISTGEIDSFGTELIRSLGGEPGFLNYNGYPAGICVSVNDEVVHGIPDRNRILRDGDIVSLDAGLVWKGWHSDAARTWPVGEVSEEALRLIELTRKSFFAGMRCARAGHHLGEVSAAIGAFAEEAGLGIVRDLAGHGIGSHLHEPPLVYNFRRKERGILLVPGMTIAVEPMMNAGSGSVEWLSDGWTVRTADGSLSAHYENTVLITDGDPELLTCTGSEEKEWIRNGQEI